MNLTDYTRQRNNQTLTPRIMELISGILHSVKQLSERISTKCQSNSSQMQQRNSQNDAEIGRLKQEQQQTKHQLDEAIRRLQQTSGNNPEAQRFIGMVEAERAKNNEIIQKQQRQISDFLQHLGNEERNVIQGLQNVNTNIDKVLSNLRGGKKRGKTKKRSRR